jgi:hypothetical protein
MSALKEKEQLIHLHLKVESGPSQGKFFIVDKANVKIGREQENDIIFPDDIKMSRQHAELVFEFGTWRIRNLSSRNFIKVNGAEVAEQTITGPTRLEIGESVIMIGFAEGATVAKIARPPTPIPDPLASVPQVRAIGGQAPIKMEPRAPRPGSPKVKTQPQAPKKRNNLVIIIITVVVAVGFLLNQGNEVAKRKRILAERERSILDLQKSQETMEKIETKMEQSGQRGIQYQLAQEQYLKGFRDYMKGQFGLAMSSFSAAVSLYPSHDLAKKYYFIAKRKFDEVVQVHMTQGKRYRGKGNYRLCKSSFENVMVMIKTDTDPIYKEAKQYRDECDLRIEGGNL